MISTYQHIQPYDEGRDIGYVESTETGATIPLALPPQGLYDLGIGIYLMPLEVFKMLGLGAAKSGKTFLAIGRTLIDMELGHLMFRLNDEKVIFNEKDSFYNVDSVTIWDDTSAVVPKEERPLNINGHNLLWNPWMSRFLDLTINMSTIKNKIEVKNGSGYKHVRGICTDIRLIFKNSMKYNEERDDVHVMARTFLGKFEDKWLQLLPKVDEELHKVDMQLEERREMVLQKCSYRGKSQDLFNAMGSMYAIVIFLGIHNSTAVQSVVSIECIIFYRESVVGIFSTLPYASGQVFIEISYVFMQSISFGVIVYAMIGFKWIAAKVRHPNLVTLMGICSESRSLAYEFLENGNLEDHLACHKKSCPLH
ncbi:hypothetical protein BC332_30478 [Capsicum chinense]|nr:hypothetical protein BC332_30478 [Capsicum chinense]